MVITVPDPEALNVPGRPALAPVRVVQLPFDTLWVVFTEPAEPPVQPVKVRVKEGLVPVPPLADVVKAIASDCPSPTIIGLALPDPPNSITLLAVRVPARTFGMISMLAKTKANTARAI
jgi:hypothetical protein